MLPLPYQGSKGILDTPICIKLNNNHNKHDQKSLQKNVPNEITK